MEKHLCLCGHEGVYIEESNFYDRQSSYYYKNSKTENKGTYCSLSRTMQYLALCFTFGQMFIPYC